MNTYRDLLTALLKLNNEQLDQRIILEGEEEPLRYIDSLRVVTDDHLLDDEYITPRSAIVENLTEDQNIDDFEVVYLKGQIIIDIETGRERESRLYYEKKTGKRYNGELIQEGGEA